MKEIFTSVSNILKTNANIIDTFKYPIKQYIDPIEINESSSVGDQIKYYRQLMGIQQKDVAKIIDIDRYTMYQLENKEYKQLYDKKHLKDVISFLDIEDKIIWNDKYLEFIYKDKQEEIYEFRMKYGISRVDLGRMMNVYEDTIMKWETNKSTISRKSYDSFIKIREEFNNSNQINDKTYNYYLFVNNNPFAKMEKYIKDEKITFKEFAKRMNRSENTLRNAKKINSISKGQYERFSELLSMKQLGIEFEDPYMKFINSKPDKFILNFLKQHNMSRAELSRQIKVGRCTVERWIRKEIVISRKNYEKLMAFISKKNNGTSA